MARDTPEARKADMLTYDAMGPLTRHVVSDSPIDLSVGYMLGQAPMECISLETDWWDDRKLATWLERQIRSKMATWAKTDWSQMRPRRVLNAAPPQRATSTPRP